MATLTTDRMAALLAPYVGDAPLPGALYEQLGAYLDLLLKWNARTNLTAVREPEAMVRRHFGEGLFAGLQVRPDVAPGATLLDFGSGAGFPGLPMQLVLPEVRVTLAESQGKKASFLREVVRTLGLRTEVWADRVERMPAERRFDVVTMRAVDNMAAARAVAVGRVVAGGLLVRLCGAGEAGAGTVVALPGADAAVLAMERVGGTDDRLGDRVFREPSGAGRG